MSKLWPFYQRMIKQYPIRTGAISAGILMSVGDFLAQTVIEKRLTTPGLQYAPKRTLRFFVFGVGFVGPTLTMWYHFLARIFGGTYLATVKMVACDQLLFAPPFMVAFLSGIKVLEGWKYEAIKQKVKDDFKDVIINNYKIWPAVQALNFTFVPVNSRIVVVNFVAVGWNTYLAWKSQHVKEPVDTDNSVSAMDANVSRTAEMAKPSKSVPVCEALAEKDPISPSQYGTRG